MTSTTYITRVIHQSCHSVPTDPQQFTHNPNQPPSPLSSMLTAPHSPSPFHQYHQTTPTPQWVKKRVNGQLRIGAPQPCPPQRVTNQDLSPWLAPPRR